MLDHLRATDAVILEKLLTKTRATQYHFVEGYRDIMRTAAGVAQRPCPYCGDVVVRYECRAIHDSAVVRYLDSCPVCGANQDTDSPGVELFIDCSVELAQGRDIPFSLEIRNTDARDVEGLVGGAFTDGDVDGLKCGSTTPTCGWLQEKRSRFREDSV